MMKCKVLRLAVLAACFSSFHGLATTAADAAVTNSSMIPCSLSKDGLLSSDAPSTVDVGVVLFDAQGKKIGYDLIVGGVGSGRKLLYTRLSGSATAVRAECWRADSALNAAQLWICTSEHQLDVDEGLSPAFREAAYNEGWLVVDVATPYVGFISGRVAATGVTVLGAKLDDHTPAWYPIDAGQQSILLVFGPLDSSEHRVVIGNSDNDFAASPKDIAKTPLGGIFPTAAICSGPLNKAA